MYDYIFKDCHFNNILTNESISLENKLTDGPKIIYLNIRFNYNNTVQKKNDIIYLYNNYKEDSIEKLKNMEKHTTTNSKILTDFADVSSVLDNPFSCDELHDIPDADSGE